MAGDPKYYGQLFAAIDGLILQELDSVEVSLEDMVQDVVTVGSEYAGITPGPQRSVVRIGSFLPSAGEEFSYSDAVRNRSFHTLKLVRADGKSWTTKGSFRSPSYGSGVGQSAKISCEFVGTPAKWE